MNATENKMNMENSGLPLKLYMFTVQQGNVNVEVAEDFKTIMAYTDTEAFERVRHEYIVGQPVSIRQRAKVEIKKIINEVDLSTDTTSQFPNFKLEVVEPIEKEKTAHDFVVGLMLIADKFVVDKRDQASIKRIIKKIKF